MKMEKNKKGVLYSGRCCCCGHKQTWRAKEDRGYKWVTIICMNCGNDEVVMWRKEKADV